MGLYLSHYVGPVLLAKQHPEEEDSKFKACSNTQCDLYRKPDRAKGKHCHECGSEIKEYKGKPQRIKKPKWFDVQEELVRNSLNSEALWCNDFAETPEGFDVLLFPNNYLGIEPPRDFQPENASHCTTLLSSVDPKGEIAWFKTTYAAHIKTLTQLYDEVVVEWGVFNYQS